MTSLRLYLFGTFEILFDGHLIQDKLWQSRQLRQVFKILADQRNKVVQSDQLIDIIWPDEPPEKSRQYLYVRISQLRKLLQLAHAESLLQRVNEGYMLRSKPIQPDQSLALWVDVDAFEEASEKGQYYLEKRQFQDAVRMLENARHIYRGDYLSEDLYQDWTIGERERLREKYIVTLIELAEAYAQQGFYRRAIDQCQTILSFDPWREAVFVRLMLYYFYAGNKAKALQTYYRCKEILSINLNLEPDPYTIWLATQIETGKLLPKSDTNYPQPAYDGRLFEVPYNLGEAPFSGRERECAWLLHQWRTKPSGLIWISGTPGIGKTRLVETFLSQIQKNDHLNLPFVSR
jgi:DNA-binding SARP family transcriptional activator